MIALVRELAGLWADKRYIKANDALRRRAIAAEAAVERIQQTAQAEYGELAAKCREAERLLRDGAVEFASASSTVKWLRAELDGKEDQIQRQANLFEQMRDQAERVARERDAARARVVELEQTIVAIHARAGLDAAWPDVAAVSGPQSKAYGRQ